MSANVFAIPEQGTVLSNGAIVIEYDSDHQKALCLWKNSRDPYVIWAIDQVTGEPYRGHYFTTLDVAVEAWMGRKGRR
jgi:hypothetical protein